MKEFFKGLGDLIVRMNEVEFTSVCKITFFLSSITVLVLVLTGAGQQSLEAAGAVVGASLFAAAAANFKP